LFLTRAGAALRACSWTDAASGKPRSRVLVRAQDVEFVEAWHVTFVGRTQPLRAARLTHATRRTALQAAVSGQLRSTERTHVHPPCVVVATTPTSHSGQQLRRLPDAAAASVAGRRTQQRLTQADTHTAKQYRCAGDEASTFCGFIDDNEHWSCGARVHT
jgi:hypothetical protein